jgi:PAS domain S-box-containing protein
MPGVRRPQLHIRVHDLWELFSQEDELELIRFRRTGKFEMTEKASPHSFGREADRDAAAVAEERDAVARERDLATQGRDMDAERRDRDADALDGAVDAADPALELRAASDRRAAAADRARAAGARTEAAQDRDQATLDRRGAADAREQASLDRRGAAHDRALAARHLADIERVAQLGSWESFVDGDEMVWTDGLYRIFGLEPGCEVTEAAFLERLHPDDRPMVASLVQHSLETREPFKYQTRIVRPSGEIVRVQAYGEVALGPDGQVRGLSGTLMDITERHIAATGERARLEADLHRAQRLDSVGQLAGGIAHDFNNILVVVQSYAEFAIAETDGAVRADIEEIRRAAERAASLTRQLLVFSRREVVAPDAVDLNCVVSETEKLLARTLGAHVELVVDRAPGLPAIKADRGQLEQVLVNLAVNARDAMPGGGRLTIRTRTVAQVEDASEEAAAAGGRYISLTVGDTGTGMSPEVRERAFEPFFTTKGSSHGTGLGLATVSGRGRRSRSACPSPPSAQERPRRRKRGLPGAAASSCWSPRTKHRSALSPAESSKRTTTAFSMQAAARRHSSSAGHTASRSICS